MSSERLTSSIWFHYHTFTLVIVYRRIHTLSVDRFKKSQQAF